VCFCRRFKAVGLFFSPWNDIRHNIFFENVPPEQAHLCFAFISANLKTRTEQNYPQPYFEEMAGAIQFLNKSRVIKFSQRLLLDEFFIRQHRKSKF